MPSQTIPFSMFDDTVLMVLAAVLTAGYFLGVCMC